MGYTFPSHYPDGCPPEPCDEELPGTYYRVVCNSDKNDPINFKSQHELNLMPHLEATEACGRRALSMFKDRQEAIALSKLIPTIGKYVACVVLEGKHGVVHKNDSAWGKTHHDWWVPLGVDALKCCTEIKEAKLWK